MLEPEQKYIQLEPQIQNILESVLQQCKSESEKGTLQIPIREYKERASYYTGFPRHFIDCIDSNELSRNYAKPLNLDIETVICIYQTMSNIYLSLKFPTFDDVYMKTKIDLQKVIIKFPYTLSEFKILMAKLGFEYRPTATRGLIMEDPKETFERYNFLTTMRKMRNLDVNIYYIDARIIDASKSFLKPQLLSDLSKTDAYTYFHIISKQADFIGLYCFNVKENDFWKWLTDIVLPMLKNHSVFVLDNNSLLHGKVASSPVTRYHSKADMLKWLRDHSIPCLGSMHKAELYSLIKNSSKNTKDLTITEQAIQAYGHTAIHLPQSLNNLSPTDFLWKHVKKEMTKVSVRCKLAAIKTELNEILNSITSEQIATFYNNVAEYEEKLCSIDIEIDNALEKYNVLIPPVNQDKISQS